MGNSQETAQAIIRQMGGLGRLRAMVNARDFVALGNGVQFAFSGSRKANKARITLSAGDFYTLELFKIRKRGLEVEAVYEAEGLYWDQLKPIFEAETGLYLSL